MRSLVRSRRGAALMAAAFAVQLLAPMVAPRPTYARVDPLNMIVQQIQKPNMLIVLDTSGSMTGVPGGTFNSSQEVGVDCDDGVNCRGGFSKGTCAATGKACGIDAHCRMATCQEGYQPCPTTSDCQPVAGRCSTGQECFSTEDCPALSNGHCAVSAATCSPTKKCTTQFRCTYGSVACVNDGDCDPGICADNVTTCATAVDCPLATTGGTCAYGTTPSGGCKLNSNCPLRAKVCSTDPSKGCNSVTDCSGVCKKSGALCTSNNNCKTQLFDSCDFSTRTCTNPTNTCMLPRQACTIRYTDNKCTDRNTCIGDPNPCTGVKANLCQPGATNDLCNAPAVTTGARMCRMTLIKCDDNTDCKTAGDSCGPATSRTAMAKRVIRSVVSNNANVVNLGLMTFYQSGYYPYYAVTGGTSTTKSVLLQEGTLLANGCSSTSGAPNSTCTINGQVYTLRSTTNARYVIRGFWFFPDTYVDYQYCGAFCSIPGKGTGVFQGAYYQYTDVTPIVAPTGNPAAPTLLCPSSTAAGCLSPTYKGKVFTQSGVTYRYYDSRSDYYNPYGSTTEPPIGTANCGSSCSTTCGGRWDTQLAPFLSTDDSPATLNAVLGAFNQAMEPAGAGGLVTYAGTPSGCALKNDVASDKNHSAYHYMAAVKAADNLSCRVNYVLFITDGEAGGPGDSTSSSNGCGSTLCAAANPLTSGCDCRAVKAAYSMRKDLGVKTFVVGFAPDATAGAGGAANNNIARAGGTDAGNDGVAPFAFPAGNERALTQAIQDAIYSAVQGSYATSPSTASQGGQQGSSYASGNMVLDSRVDFPSWRGHLIAYDVSSASPTLQWDAGVKLEAMDWRQRKIYTSDGDNNVFKVDVNATSGAIVNRSRLFDLDLGESVEEAETISRWMLGDPALDNPAVLGAIIGSTPVDVGPPVDGPLPGQSRFHLAQKDRPSVTYVGSNDGMLHAFFTRTVTVGGVTYEGGSEAFAYLAPNMMPMVTKLYAQGGQLADPKKFIYGGLANSPKVKSLCVSNCSSDSDAVWKTLLVVTQGWGGNEIFMLDVTNPLSPPQLYWSSIRQGWPAAYDRALGLTVSVPAFTFHRTDGQDDYRLLLASGYPVTPGSTTQGRSLLSVSVRTGAVMDEEVLPGSGTCAQEYTLISDVATSRKQFKNDQGKSDGRKEFLTAYLGDTWGKLWRYGPDAELVTDFGCSQPLHFSPTIVQLDADDPNNPHGGDTYLVQVTNSSLDYDTRGFAPSKMIVLKEVNVSGHPQLDTTFGTQGMVTLTTSNTAQMCGVTDATGEVCLTALPANTRPLSTPLAIPKIDGTGFFIMSTWYVPGGCSKGTTYLQIHDFSGNTPKLKQAVKIADEPVISPIIVGGKLMVSSSKGPVGVDGTVTTAIVRAKPPDTNIGDIFEMGGWSEIQ